MLVHVILFQRSLRPSSFFFILVSFFCPMAVFSTALVFHLTYSFFYLIYSAIDSFQSTFHLLHCSSLLFKASVSIQHFLYLLSLYLHSFSEILDHLFYCLYPEFFFSRLPISTSLSCSYRDLSCSFFCNKSLPPPFV